MRLPILLAFSLAALVRVVPADVEWEPHVLVGGQLFPAFIIGTHGVDFSDEEPDPAVIGDAGGLMGAIVQTSTPGTKVELEVSCPDLIAPSTLSATLEEAGTEYGLLPILTWDFDRLHTTYQAVPVVISFKLTVDGEPAGTKQAKAFLRSVNDCPFVMYDELGDELIDTSWLFAAYVNEDHPWIDQMLREALDLKVVESFTGYQSGDPMEVVAQVYSIWKTLRLEGIQYSNITQAVGKEDAALSQEVRFLDQAVGNAQANCVDGSVLMASFLRKVDIGPGLVFVPGHCFLAFSLDEQGQEILGLETTLLGSKVENPNEILEAVKGIIEFPKEMASDEDWLSFLHAVLVGTANLEEHRAEFEDENNPSYQLINVDEARKLGIMPIAYVEP